MSYLKLGYFWGWQQIALPSRSEMMSKFMLFLSIEMSGLR